MSSQAPPHQTASPPPRRLTVPQIRARKGKAPIVALTAATAPMAERVDRHADLILVGDSLGMVLYGLDSTLGVTLDMMIQHGQAVMRRADHALVVVDMPFGSYEESPQQAFRNAARLMAETGCGAVKLEGGARMAETIAFLTSRGIPVLAHIGLTPQSSHVLGGFRTQGRDHDSWPAHHADAQAVTEAGAFAVVIEGVVADLARALTAAIPIPTIGIGAAAECDGQILVTEDMLGFHDWAPKFVRRYAECGAAMEEALAGYAADVRERRFPGKDELYD